MATAPNYDFWLLDNTLTRITKIPTLMPLDKSGTIIQFSNELDEFGQAKFRVSAYDALLTTFGDILQPHVNWLQIVKNGETVWQGAIIDNTKRTKEYIESIAVEPLWYLNKVLIQRTSTDPANGQSDGIYRIFNSGTMSAAVTAFMNETINTFKANSGSHPLAGLTLGTVTNPNYPPNMTNGNNPPTALSGPWSFGNGTTAPQLQFDFHTVLYVLKSMGLYTYADFYITTGLQFNFVPFKGNDLSKSVQFSFSPGGVGSTPANIVDYNIPRFGQRQLNDLYGIATDINGNVLHYDGQDQASTSKYGLLQGVAAYSDVKDQATLNARIQAELPLISAPDNTAITITQSEQGYPLGTYSVGDIVTINIKNKGVTFNDVRRVVGITVKVENTGREMITIQTNKVLPFQWVQAGGTNQTGVTT